MERCGVAWCKGLWSVGRDLVEHLGDGGKWLCGVVVRSVRGCNSSTVSTTSKESTSDTSPHMECSPESNLNELSILSKLNISSNLGTLRSPSSPSPSPSPSPIPEGSPSPTWKLLDDSKNSVHKLLKREINGAWNRRNSEMKFRNFHLQDEFDTHDYYVSNFSTVPSLKKRSRIVEIVAAQDIVFALTYVGKCVAFSRVTNKRISLLNISPDEEIRQLFYNKMNNSLITVSVYAPEYFYYSKCRTTHIEYIRRGQPDAGFPLFESEPVNFPGFIKFDDVNWKLLTWCAKVRILKVFDLKDYTMLYSISAEHLEEIKISPGIMLLIFERAQCHVPLKILSIEDGSVLKVFNHPLHCDKEVKILEQFNEKLLVKQENENLQILDVMKNELTEVSRTVFMTPPSSLFFLYEYQLFIAFTWTVDVWNFRGECVSSCDDHVLWKQVHYLRDICITSEQDLIVSYCEGYKYNSGEEVGTINISNILTGKCLAKIRADDASVGISPRARTNSSGIRSSVGEALEDITSLSYNEDLNEVYTGKQDGVVHVWSN